MNSQKTIEELHKAFSLLNQTFYNNELPTPYIVIFETARKNAYGWFTPNKVWQDAEGKEAKHEIAMSAEYMNRDYVDVIGTLHHEMIHLYCHINNINDTSRQGRYHNKNFKRECESRGFYFDQEEPHSTYGWSFTKLTKETRELIESFGLDEKAFSLARVVQAKKSNTSSQSKYICTSCDTTFKAKKNLNIVCGECDEPFIEEEG